MKNTVLALLLAFSSGVAFGQEAEPSILLITGKTVEGTVVNEDSLFIHYVFEKRSGKRVEKKLDWERVFSFVDAEGNERVIYVPDSTLGNYFTEEEMRYYIKGEQDALSGYKSNWTIWVGVPVSGGLGYVLSSSPLVFTVPFFYMIGAALPKYKMTPSSISDASLLRQPAYILGYERTARTKRLFKSLASGMVGAAVGVLIGQLTKP
jgi:hypothetical protein